MYQPTVTKEVAAAIDYIKENGVKGEDVMVGTGKSPYNKDFGRRTIASIEDLDALTLVYALVNGYEIEKTPEEKLLAYYKNMWMCEDDSGTMYSLGVCEGIRNTLEILGITVEGINTQDYGF